MVGRHISKQSDRLYIREWQGRVPSMKLERTQFEELGLFWKMKHETTPMDRL